MSMCNGYKIARSRITNGETASRPKSAGGTAFHVFGFLAYISPHGRLPSIVKECPEEPVLEAASHKPSDTRAVATQAWQILKASHPKLLPQQVESQGCGNLKTENGEGQAGSQHMH